MRTRTRVVTIATATALLLGVAPAGARSGSRATVESGTSWVHVHGGMTFGDTVILGDQPLTLTGAEGPAPTFGIAVLFRTSALDFGALFESLGSFRFQGLEQLNRVGSQLRFAGVVRWRYIDEGWGALFLRLSPGLFLARHADELRFQVAQLSGDDLDDVDEVTPGFALGFDFGVMLYLSEHIALSADLDIVTGAATITSRSADISYSMIRGVFNVSLEWQL